MKERTTYIWTVAVLCFVVLMIVTPAIPQSQSYHDFADKRQFSGFLIQWCGVQFPLSCHWSYRAGAMFSWQLLSAKIWGWTVFFIGVAAISIGSSYYHLQPNDARLVWDRLLMTIAFGSIAAIFVIERIDERKGTIFIIPFLVAGVVFFFGGSVAGVVSILYWRFFEDLRPYAVVQFLPCIAVPLMAILVPPMYTHSTYWFWAAAFYLLAKIEEAADKLTYELTHHLVSGHTLKHLFAAMVPVFLALMLAKRRVEIQRLEKRRAHDQNQSVKLKDS